MIDAFEETYNLILEKGDASVKAESAYFDALLTCTNQDFLSGVKLELTKWESGENVTFDKLKVDPIHRYNNITKRLKKEGKPFANFIARPAATPESSDKAKMIAMTTTLQNMTQLLSSIENSSQTKNYYWCPHHKFSGFYDGLYVTHPPEKHDKWRDRQDRLQNRGKYAFGQSLANSARSAHSGGD